MPGFDVCFFKKKLKRPWFKILGVIVSKKTERHRSSVGFFCCVTSTESGRGVVNRQYMAVTGFFLLDVSIMSVHIFVHCARGPNWYARTSVCHALCFVWVSSAMGVLRRAVIAAQG